MIEGLEDLGNILGRTKAIVSSAIVFMVRWIWAKWKQPISFYLTGSTVTHSLLQELVQETIRSVLSTGLNPLGVVCDQGPNNRACLSRLGVSSDHPYFHLDGRRYLVLYDPPHLLKNNRNNLKNSRVVFMEVKEVKWDHIKDFHVQDTKLSVRLVRKLKKKYIELPGFKNMSVRLAARTLSRSVCLMHSIVHL